MRTRCCSCPACTPAWKGPPLSPALHGRRCVGRERVLQAPLWLLACLLWTTHSASKQHGLPWTPGMAFASDAARVVPRFPRPLPGAESKLIRGGGRQLFKLALSFPPHFPSGRHKHFQEQGLLRSTHKEPAHKHKAAFYSPAAEKRFPTAVRFSPTTKKLKYKKGFC